MVWGLQGLGFGVKGFQDGFQLASISYDLGPRLVEKSFGFTKFTS